MYVSQSFACHDGDMDRQLVAPPCHLAHAEIIRGAWPRKGSAYRQKPLKASESAHWCCHVALQRCRFRCLLVKRLRPSYSKGLSNCQCAVAPAQPYRNRLFVPVNQSVDIMVCTHYTAVFGTATTFGW